MENVAETASKERRGDKKVLVEQQTLEQGRRHVSDVSVPQCGSFFLSVVCIVSCCLKNNRLHCVRSDRSEAREQCPKDENPGVSACLGTVLSSCTCSPPVWQGG